MSPKLPRITAAQLIKALAKDGWYFSRQQGSHAVFRNEDKPARRVVVPVHSGKILRPGLLRDILKDADLTPEDLERLQ